MAKSARGVIPESRFNAPAEPAAVTIPIRLRRSLRFEHGPFQPLSDKRASCGVVQNL